MVQTMARKYSQVVFGGYVQFNKDGTVRDWHFTVDENSINSVDAKDKFSNALYEAIMKFGFNSLGDLEE